MTIEKYKGKVWGIPAVKYEFIEQDYDMVQNKEAVIELLEWHKERIDSNVGDCTHLIRFDSNGNKDQDIIYINNPNERKARLEILIASSSGVSFFSPKYNQRNMALVDFLDIKLLKKEA
nr:hypothetical protein [Candidatus Woesearchaeota archaeon]